MAEETPEERLDRFREMAQRFYDNLDLSMKLAASNNPQDREIAKQMLPIWLKYSADWARTIARLEQQIADGTTD